MADDEQEKRSDNQSRDAESHIQVAELDGRDRTHANDGANGVERGGTHFVITGFPGRWSVRPNPTKSDQKMFFGWEKETN